MNELLSQEETRNNTKNEGSSSIQNTDEKSKDKNDGTFKAQCYGTLMQMDLKNGMFLVGDSFMRKFYTVFDRDHDRIGLAESIII